MGWAYLGIICAVCAVCCAIGFEKFVWFLSIGYGFAIIGGGIGAFLGMQVFRHKTKHTQFVIGIPMIMIAQLILIGWLWLKVLP